MTYKKILNEAFKIASEVGESKEWVFDLILNDPEADILVLIYQEILDYADKNYFYDIKNLVTVQDEGLNIQYTCWPSAEEVRYALEFSYEINGACDDKKTYWFLKQLQVIQ